MPSAVAVRRCAGLAGAKFALLSGRSATGRTMDGKYLFGSKVFFHREDDDPNRCTGMVNLEQSYENQLERFTSLRGKAWGSDRLCDALFRRVGG
jgi:hypothetical protein